VVSAWNEGRKLRIAMFGHKRIPSREGGIEIVVQELSTRLAKLGHEVICYNRSGHHVSGGQLDLPAENRAQGVRARRCLRWTEKALPP